MITVILKCDRCEKEGQIDDCKLFRHLEKRIVVGDSAHLVDLGKIGDQLINLGKTGFEQRNFRSKRWNLCKKCIVEYNKHMAESQKQLEQEHINYVATFFQEGKEKEE